MTAMRSKGALLILAVLAAAPAAQAQDCMIGEVRMFAGNFAPRNWALLDGQLLAISQNAALFSILGTMYGGDGRTTFALPDMRGRVAAHAGQGPGLARLSIGAAFGSEQTTLTVDNLASHDHPAQTETRLNVTTERARRTLADGGVPGRANGARVYSNKPVDAVMGATAATSETHVAPAGEGQPIGLAQPSLAINHIICLFGIFPSRN